MSEIEKVASVSTSVVYTDDFRGLQYGFDFNLGSTGGFIWYDLIVNSQDCQVPGAVVADTGSGYTECQLDVTKAIGGTPITWPGVD